MVVYGQDVALERRLMDIEHDEVLGNDNLDGENGVFLSFIKHVQSNSRTFKEQNKTPRRGSYHVIENDPWHMRMVRHSVMDHSGWRTWMMSRMVSRRSVVEWTS